MFFQITAVTVDFCEVVPPQPCSSWVCMWDLQERDHLSCSSPWTSPSEVSLGSQLCVKTANVFTSVSLSRSISLRLLLLCGDEWEYQTWYREAGLSPTCQCFVPNFN